MEGFEVKVDPIWKHKDVVGIDIGTRTLKCVQLKKNGHKTTVVGYGQMDIPENYITEGVIAEPEKLAQQIKDFIDQKIIGKITAKRVYASLPESKVFTRTISLPRSSEKDVAEAVNWDASQTVPMAMSDLYVDWQVIDNENNDSDLFEVLYAAAPKAIVNSYVQLYGLLGMEISGIETTLTSITRAISTYKKIKETFLVIDIGSKTTNLAVCDNAIRVTESCLVGGEQLTAILTKALNIEVADLEKFDKEKIPAKDLGKIKEIVVDTISDIAKEATRMINYYEEKNQRKIKVTKVLLCGGSASLPLLPDVLADKLAIKVEVLDNLAGLNFSKKCLIPKLEMPTYIDAIGLAQIGVEND